MSSQRFSWHTARYLILGMLLCAAQLDQQVQAQRGARPAQAHTYEPPHRADTSRPQEQSRNSQHDQFTPHQTDHNSEARDGSNERATFDLFGNRLHEALAEILQRAAILEASIRVRVSNHLCCDFSRPSKTSYDDVYRKAEEKIRSTYFDMPFHSEAHRFVFTTDDTIILRMLDNSKLPHFEKATGATNWSSLQNIQNRLSELRRQLGDGGRVIMVGHQENGQIVIRDPKGDRSYNITDLQQLAASLNLELLVWSCDSAKHAVGGVDQAFRESILTKALISALSKPADTLGGFLDQLSRASGVRWVFNAVQMITLQQTVATVVDKTGREAEVQMPAVPNPTKWMNAANGQFSPLGTTNGGTANSNQQASAPIQKLATDPPPSLWQQSMSYLSRALRICSTIFIVSLILGGIQEMIFFVRGVSGRATILLMPIAFTMFSAGVLATIGLGSAVLSSNLAAGIAGTILVGLGVLCYKAIIWLEPPSS